MSATSPNAASGLGLAGKSAIVTGASRGIGAAIALALAGHGARVMLTARDHDLLMRQADEIDRQTGVRPAFLAGDLRLAETCQRVVTGAVDQFGGLDILVNNAGATRRGPFLEMADEDYLDGFALKFHAAVRLCRLSWEHLKRRNGSLVNISGIAARTPGPDFTVGGPVNAAVVNFTKAIAEQGLRDGVRVNAINPGHIATDRLQTRIQRIAAEHGASLAEAEDIARRQYGIGSFGEAADIANVVAFLCSDQAAYVHGATIDVDGGATKGI